MSRTHIKFTSGSTVIYVAATKVSENYTNGLTSFTQPTTDETPVTTSLINLNRMEDRFTINGYITEGKMETTDTYTTALDKKNGLKTMFAKGQTVTMTYEDVGYDVGVDKYEIVYDSRDDADGTQSDVIAYNVTISVIVGSDLV